MRGIRGLTDSPTPALSDDAPETVAADAARPLNPRQKRFVSEYVIDLNGAAAAIRSGYSANCAPEIASRLLSEANIRASVDRTIAQRQAAVNVTSESVLQEMSRLANSCVDHYYVTDAGYLAAKPDAPEGAMGAVSSVKRKMTIHTDRDGFETGRTYEIEFKLWDKTSSLKLMGRHTGIFADRVEVTGKNGGPLDIAIARVERVIVDEAGMNAGLNTNPNANPNATLKVIDAEASPADTHARN